MSPSDDQLLRRLRSSSAKERLEAARYLAEYAHKGHSDIIREALARERVQWIRSALRRALARFSSDFQFSLDRSIDRDDLPEGFAAQVYSEALETTASQLMHEIEPILGGLRLAAELEVNNFENSNTKRALDRLDDFFDALSRLRRAASAPKTEPFALDEAIIGCVEEISIPQGVEIQKSGQHNCIVDGDRGLVLLTFANGLRNAIDATSELTGDLTQHPIAVSWGTTDVDIWISIVDSGVGFKGNVERAFEMGTTTKAGHLGMGLAIANQAVTSLGGRLALVPNERGVRFEMRWPKKPE